jgi:hypothetical protein
MATLGDGFVAIRPLVNQGAFGSELGGLLSGPLNTIEQAVSGKLESGLAKLAQGFGASEQAAAKFAATAVPVAAGIGLGTAALSAEIAVMDRVVGAYEGLAQQIVQVQRITGASAEDSSRLVAVLQDYNVSVQQASTALLRFDNNIQTHQKNLQALGVVTRDQNGNVLQGIPALLSLADAYSHATTQAERTDLIVQSFGTRIGAQLIPLLQQGKAGLQQLFADVPSGVILDQKQVDAAVQFKVSVTELGQSFRGLEVEAGSVLVPTLTRVVDGFAVLGRAADDLGKHVGGVGPVITGLTSVVSPLLGAIGGLGGILDELAGHHNKAAAAAQVQAQAEAQLAKDINTGESALESLVSATNTYSDAQQTVIDDTQNVATLTQQVNDLQLNSAATMELFASNALSLAQANQQVADTTERVSQAYTALQNILHPSAETIGKAQLAVDQANQNLINAHQGVADATQNLRDIEARSLNDPRVPDARNQLANAQLAVTSATYGLTDAEKALHDLENPQGTDALTQAENNYNDAVLARTAAEQKANDAQRTVDQERATRLADLTTKTDQLHTAEGRLAKDRETVGLDAIKLMNAQDALASDLSDKVNTGLRNQLDLIKALYPAAADAITQIESLLPPAPATSPAPAPGQAGRNPNPRGGPGAASGNPAPPSEGGPPSASIPTARGAAVHITQNIYPSQGLSEQQIGNASAQSLIFGMKR